MRRTLFNAAVNVSTSILEVGCATCIDYELFQEANIEYVGLDLTHRLLLFAKKYVPSFILIQGDGRQLPFRNHCFDTVYCKDVIEHLLPNDYKVLIKEMWRVAKKQILLCFFGDTRIHTEIRDTIHCTINDNIQDGPVYFTHYAENKLLEFFKELSYTQLSCFHGIPYGPSDPEKPITLIDHGGSMYRITKEAISE